MKQIGQEPRTMVALYVRDGTDAAAPLKLQRRTATVLLTLTRIIPRNPAGRAGHPSAMLSPGTAPATEMFCSALHAALLIDENVSVPAPHGN
jgi:hypothetical protein